MKTITKIAAITLLGFALFACAKSNKKNFKEQYESLNNNPKEGSQDLYQEVNIDENHPFVYTTEKEILKKLENKDTFYIYFGARYCPDCRSVVEQATNSAILNNIKEILYFDAWNGEDHKEILRDKYSLINGELVQEVKGSEVYYKLLEYFDEYLKDYEIEGIKVNEKRLFLPTFVYIENGIVKKLTTGTSELLLDETSTKIQIQEDQLRIFNEFFQKDACVIGKPC